MENDVKTLGFEEIGEVGHMPGGAPVACPHRKHQRDVFHAWMLEGVEFSRTWEMPVLDAVRAEPESLIPFSAAMRQKRPEPGTFVHFFEDDFRFERIWNNPRTYLPKLREYSGVVMPDFSVATDFPVPLKIWNAYRNELLGAWLQKQGLVVIPNVRSQTGCPWLMEGLPADSTIAICGRGLVKNRDERRRLARDIRATVDEMNPASIVYYGADAYGLLEYPRKLGIPVFVFSGEGRGGREGGRRG